MGYRIGFGYDVHRLVENRTLMIGGVLIDHEYGLSGHSDADVLVHAIMDGIIGALGKGDIGQHFPDDDEQFKDISSLYLLEKVRELLMDKQGRIVNIDCVIVAQRPKMRPHIPFMEEKIATVLKIEQSQINIKATTEEGLGFTGEEKGISAKAVVLLEM